MVKFNHKQLKQLSLSLASLSIDMVQQAKSGHPGMPMGMADITAVLAAHYLKCNADGADRIADRLILSNGHGSALQYSLLHLLKCKGYELEQLKRFRQVGSNAPGHPEYDPKLAIETTTGPLGQGLANAVGIAIAAKKNNPLSNAKIYCYAGDGCMMEGISHEACSLAGHLALDNLIVIYDHNSITIDGATNLAFSDDTEKRFAALNWRVFNIDGHNFDQIDEVLGKAASNTSNKPILIIAKTNIANLAPTKQGKADSHGAPLGEDEIAEFKRANSLPQEAFKISDEAETLWGSLTPFKLRTQNEFDIQSALNKLNAALKEDKNVEDEASRKSSGIVLSHLDSIKNIVIGSADLTDSNCVRTNNYQPITANNYTGNFIHYGVREHAMAAIMNGMATAEILPIGSTFLCFSDYLRPALRLSCLMKLQVIYVLTHDSIGLGEDGPTHQPVEHLESLRLIPNLQVMRPACRVETYIAYIMALKHKGPSVIALSRQNLKQLDVDKKHHTYQEYGANLVWRHSKNKIDILFYATGSEVSLAIEVAKKIAQHSEVNLAVISVLDVQKFIKYQQRYLKAVAKSTPKLQIAIEAGREGSWRKIIKDNGLFFGCDSFGISAPINDVYQHFSLNVDVITKKMLEHL